MSKVNLDGFEKQILADFEAGEFESVLTEERKKEIEEAAKNTFKKGKRINIQISSRDLSALQRRVLEEGIPYQTLVSSILNKYVSGSLQDITSNKPIERVR